MHLCFRYCRLDYLRALAAIAAAFPAEMHRKTYVQGRTVGHILWCAAAPEKVAWQWNALIVRRALPHAWMTLLPAGTASNESLHAELNSWWRNAPEQFPTTLELHLHVGWFAKLLAHNAALYRPTLRQVISRREKEHRSLKGVMKLTAWNTERIRNQTVSI